LVEVLPFVVVGLREMEKGVSVEKREVEVRAGRGRGGGGGGGGCGAGDLEGGGRKRGRVVVSLEAI